MPSMNTDIKELCKQLLALLNEYSDCWGCGEVIKDSSLLVPDPLNPGLFRTVCPSCDEETWRSPFPPKELRTIFEMIVECAELDRPILVLVLSCTVYEAMLDGFVFRLFERRHASPEICDAVINATEYRQKLKIIQGLTGKPIKKLTQSAGFKELTRTLEEIKRKRN